jgi:hypothetical protein
LSADGYVCASCGERHEGPALCYGPAAPVQYDAVAPEERDRRCTLTGDACLIDDEHWFLRGRIELPIIGREEPFAWLVWVSQSQASMEKMMAAWESPARVDLEPTFGWLSSQLGCYPNTINLKTMVHQRPPGERPWIELERTQHPLAVEQREGITWERVCEIDAWARHG